MAFRNAVNSFSVYQKKLLYPGYITAEKFRHDNNI